MNLLPRTRLLAVTALVATSTALAGCAPIAFQGTTAMVITGNPPAPPPPPEPEPVATPVKVVPKRVEVRGDKVVINEKVQFEQGKAIIRDVSFDLLNEVAKVINDNPNLKKIRVEGHASAEGSASTNLKLSKRRAKAVMEYLVSKGSVAAERLESEGYGITKPLDTNDTEEGREKNRRVEFTILEQDVTKKKVEVDPTTGEEKVIEETTETVTK